MNGLGKHNERTTETKNADPEKAHLNQHIISTDNLNRSIHDRIKAGYTGKTAIRKDAVTSISLILSGSHAPMDRIVADNRLDEWVQANQQWVADNFGKENMVMFSLHMDESCPPHIHAIIVPLTPDGRLSARDVMGDKKQLREYQDSYALAMDKFGMERGIRKTKDSKVRHVDVNEYYKLINEDLPEKRKELDTLKTEIDDFSTLKASKQFWDRITGQGEIKTLKNEISTLKNEISALQEERSHLKDENQNLKAKTAKLEENNSHLSGRIGNIAKEIESLKETTKAEIKREKYSAVKFVNTWLRNNKNFELDVRGFESQNYIHEIGQGRSLNQER